MNDLISRQAAIEKIHWLGLDNDTAIKCDLAIRALPSVNPQEPCEDAISRQAALDAFGLFEKTRKYGGDYSGYDTMLLYEIQQTLEDLPPVNPQPKTGHWIKDDITERSKSEYKHKCDRCGAYHRAMYDYCPSCGTRMESEDKA